jgi:copper chaperone CopZ
MSPDSISGEYLVDGMTCSHCVASVTDELGRLAGVENVSVELAVGGASKVTVASDRPLLDDDVRAAIEVAGYTMAGQ